MKATPTFIDYHAEQLFALSSNADAFASTMRFFLESNGWSEDEYNDHVNQSEKLS